MPFQARAGSQATPAIAGAGSQSLACQEIAAP
jgi:hypothetical protein